ncbi:MAG: hypothetical protein JZU67_06905, partial [Burkholderiaceae bacterium]|nr:hypothetical protein [Burkholderiaceae bacterium]
HYPEQNNEDNPACTFSSPDKVETVLGEDIHKTSVKHDEENRWESDRLRRRKKSRFRTASA